METAAIRIQKERRQHHRLPVSIPVFIRGTDGDGKEFLEFATALNISASGVLLATRRNLRSVAIISLEIPVAPLPAGAEVPFSIRCLKARLVRVTHAESVHLVGLKFRRTMKT